MQRSDSPDNRRQTVVLTLVLTAILAVYTLLASGGDWVTTLLFVPVIASVTFWTLRLSMRVGRRWSRPVSTRLEQRPSDSVLSEPTTERPAHAQHRREQARRRPRGGRLR